MRFGELQSWVVNPWRNDWQLWHGFFHIGDDPVTGRDLGVKKGVASSVGVMVFGDGGLWQEVAVALEKSEKRGGDGFPELNGLKDSPVGVSQDGELEAVRHALSARSCAAESEYFSP